MHRIPWLISTAFWMSVGIAGVAAEPHVFWASDPVRPNETVLVQGSDLGGMAAEVKIARITETGHGVALSSWVGAPILQGSENSLKFVIPATFQPGVYAYRIRAGGVSSKEMFLNAPDPWWIQGDEGASSTPGGWLRVMGKSLAFDGKALATLKSGNDTPVILRSSAADKYSLRFEIPAHLAPGHYALQVGDEVGWRSAGTLTITAPPAIPQTVYSVLDFYKSDPDAVKKMRDTLVKYRQPEDRTEGVLAALDEAAKNGGGIVYFPGGRYMIRGPLKIPPHTILRGEGEGVVTLWWGTGHFNLDGGGNVGRAKVDEPPPPSPLISGSDFGLENMSLYFPLDYDQGITAADRFRMNHVRIRIDHYWLAGGRGNGVVARLGNNFQVTDCDILSKGDGLVPGEYGLIARNHIYTNKTNTPLGGSRQVIVEDNRFTSMDPTAYQNISGTGRNLYYARNIQESLYVHQADYSFTFDAGVGCYVGGLAQVNGTEVTLGGDPNYPKWAPEKNSQWHHSVLCIVGGRGMGQWRDVVSNEGRAWKIDRPFDTAPDASSVASIVFFNGRVLVIGNTFEDANWVNAGYGTSFDVIYAENKLFRCADLMNYGLRNKGDFQPSWHVQYLDNVVSEGQTGIGSSGGRHEKDAITAPLTYGMIHRGNVLTADNSGSIAIGDGVLDAIVEDCSLENPLSKITVAGTAQGVVCRDNIFGGEPSPRYAGDGIRSAVVVPNSP